MPALTSPIPWIDALTQETVPPEPEVAANEASWQETRLLVSSLKDSRTRIFYWDSPLPWMQSIFSPMRRSDLLEKIEAASTPPRTMR